MRALAVSSYWMQCLWQETGNCRGAGLHHSRWDLCQLPSWISPQTGREPQLPACGDHRVRGMSRHWKCFRELRSEKYILNLVIIPFGRILSLHRTSSTEMAFNMERHFYIEDCPI